MSQLTELPEGSKDCTRNTLFQSYSNNAVYPSTTSPIFAPTIAVHLYERRSPRTKKLSAAQASDQRALTDRAYKERMELARVELAKDLYEESFQSIAKLRLQRGLSQAELARKLGTSQPHIAKIEAKQVRIQLDTAAKLAKALNVDMNTISSILEDLPADPNLQSINF